MNAAPDESCDVLIVGGGPAGSTCARHLIRAGLNVVVIDRATFPRDKTCGGWITPQVVQELEIGLDEYRPGRTLQPIQGFRTGIVGRAEAIETDYGKPVSYGIRRCEFDHFLLERSGAHLQLGQRFESLDRHNNGWLVNGRLRASLVIGAGGHFCPVARHLNESHEAAEFVVQAQETEFPMSADQIDRCSIRPDVPELYFFPDFHGYAWCFRKNDYLNVGLGRFGERTLTSHKSEFLNFLHQTNRISFEPTAPFKGHAYRLRGFGTRRIVGDGLLLIGDAAGIAYPQSGEGIRPAVESGLLAAETIVESKGRYDRESLQRYEQRLEQQLGPRESPRWLNLLPEGLTALLGRNLTRTRWFTRNVLLDRWFLHADKPPLQIVSPASAHE